MRDWYQDEQVSAKSLFLAFKDQLHAQICPINALLLSFVASCWLTCSLNSSLAAFLGDTKFPQIIMLASKGERILRYQDLYRNYSRLGLSWPKDRLFAIDGLQGRLLEAFDTEGGFGIFDDGLEGGHLRRSLLWHRGNDVPPDPGLLRITFPDHSGGASAVPSWSWMAYTGGIDYLQLEFNGVDWVELRSPWARDDWEKHSTAMPPQPGGYVALGGKARTFDVAQAKEEEWGLIYDRSEEISNVQCVVLGVTRERVQHGLKRNYVLLITPADTDAKNWRRVGVGYMPGKCILGPGSPVTII